MCYFLNVLLDSKWYFWLVRVFQRNRINEICVHMCVCTRRDDGIVLDWVWTSKARRGDAVSSSSGPSLTVGWGQCPNSKTVRQRERIPPSSTFCPTQALNRLDDTSNIREDNLLCPVHQPKLVSSRNTQNNVWPNIQTPCGPNKLTHKVNHHVSYIIILLFDSHSHNIYARLIYCFLCCAWLSMLNSPYGNNGKLSFL